MAESLNLDPESIDMTVPTTIIPTTIVQTPEIKQSIVQMVSAWFVNHEPTLVNILIVAMSVVEKLQSDPTLGPGESLKGAAKTIFAKEIVPIIIHYLGELKKLEPPMVQLLLDQFTNSGDMIDGLIKSLVSLTNDPNLLNGKWILDNTIGRIKNSCFPCKAKSVK